MLAANSILETTRAQAEHTPDAHVILAPERVPLTYAGLTRQASYVRSYLNGHGIGREDRVAIVVPNGPELTTCFLAIAGAATSAPLNPAYTESEFEFYLSDLHAKAVVVQAHLESPARSTAKRLGLACLELTPETAEPAGVFSLVGGTKSETKRSGRSDVTDIALLLHTSGTTSRPKLVPLTHRNLCTAAMRLGRWFGLTAADRSLTFMPLFHIQGLVAGVLAPVMSGGSIASIPRFNADEFFAQLNRFEPTWYTAGPTYHRAILSRARFHRDVLKHHKLRVIRSSSAPLAVKTMQDLDATLGVPVVESYGLTETCLHATSNPLPPGRRKAGSVGLPDGVEIMIEDQSGKAAPPDTYGEVLIAGPSVTSAYENNPEANAMAFKGKWFRTGDLGAVDEEGYLKLNGRIKELINRGGEKVSPAEVDRALLEHPDVVEAATFAVPHPTLGEDVATAIVPRQGACITSAAIRSHAAERLAQHKIPRKLVVLDELPKGSTGKLQRIGLAEKLGLHGRRSKWFKKPRDPMEVHLQNIFQNILETESVGTTDDFFDLGGDSLAAVRLLLEVKQQFGISLPEEFLMAEGATIRHIAAAIRRRLRSLTSK